MRATYKGSYKLRYQVLERDNFTCQYCGQYAPNVCLEVDHRIPRSEGGADEESNLVTSCWACNRGKNGLRVTARKNPPYPAKRQEQIIDLVKKSGTGLSSKEIQQACHITRANVDVLTKRMRDKGTLAKTADNKWLFVGYVPKQQQTAE